MKVKGCNKFKIPHMQKDRLEKEGRLPLQIACEASLLLVSLQIRSCKLVYGANEKKMQIWR